LVWAGGIAGRAAVQMRLWIKRWRAAIDQRRAKGRELAHLKARQAEQVAQDAQDAQDAEDAKAKSSVPQPDVLQPRPHQAPGVAAELAPDNAGADAPVATPATPQAAARPPSKRKKRRHRAET
jgi:hypothetical protein